MVVNYFFLGVVLGHPPLIIHYMVNVVFPPSRINPAMKELCVGITFFDVCNSGTLLLACFLEHSQAYDPSLEPSPKVELLGGEQPSLLSTTIVQFMCTMW